MYDYFLKTQRFSIKNCPVSINSGSCGRQQTPLLLGGGAGVEEKNTVTTYL